MPLSRDFLLLKGFIEYPHFTIGNALYLDIGRRRRISISNLGNPNEMASIQEMESETVISDFVCIHNFDYDGYLTEEKVNNLLSIFNANRNDFIVKY